jgi:hypothetical protein
MKVLICSIIRDRAFSLPLWHQQIKRLIDDNPDIEWHLSFVENSSIDTSRIFLVNASWATCGRGPASYYYLTENLGTPRYGSVKDQHRCELLAAQRNKAMLVPALQVVDKVLWIEPDIKYDVDRVRSLLDSEADVISPNSIQGNCLHYDSWSTRRNQDEEEWTGPVPNEVIPMRTTWCQLCALNAHPIRRHNLRFDSINPRTLRWDNDVVSIIESMRMTGATDVRLDGTWAVEHFIG